MDSPEFAEWQAFSLYNPFLPERLDFGLAQISCILANVNRDTKEHPSPFTIADFMPDIDPFGEESKKQKKQTDRMMKTTFGQITKALKKRKGM